MEYGEVFPVPVPSSRERRNFFEDLILNQAAKAPASKKKAGKKRHLRFCINIYESRKNILILRNVTDAVVFCRLSYKLLIRANIFPLGSALA